MGSYGTRRLQVLYIGNEALLSKATAEVLKRSGFKVRATSPFHAHHALRRDNFLALILCATLTADETQEIVHTASEAQPDTPIVSVHLGLLGDAPNSKSTVVVDALNGPDALVRAVESVAGGPRHLVGKAS